MADPNGRGVRAQGAAGIAAQGMDEAYAFKARSFSDKRDKKRVIVGKHSGFGTVG